MAVWIDDLLTRQSEWYRMTGNACALLIELWSESKTAGNDGAFEVDRLWRVADHYSPEARDELVQHGWLHEEGQGCPSRSDLCINVGVPGYVILHNVVGRQESSVLSSDRRKSDFIRSRQAGLKANHVRHHERQGVVKEGCQFCSESSDSTLKSSESDIRSESDSESTQPNPTQPNPTTSGTSPSPLVVAKSVSQLQTARAEQK